MPRLPSSHPSGFHRTSLLLVATLSLLGADLGSPGIHSSSREAGLPGLLRSTGLSAWLLSVAPHSLRDFSLKPFVPPPTGSPLSPILPTKRGCWHLGLSALSMLRTHLAARPTSRLLFLSPGHPVA